MFSRATFLFGDDKAAFKKMCDFARNDEKVKSQISNESIEEARKDFDEDVDLSWMKKLSKNDDGEIQNTVNNLVIILENDEQLKDIAYNTLAGTAEVIGAVPWLRVGSTKFWRDGDTSQLKVYVEKHYASFSDRNFEIAFTKVTEDRAFNPIRQYLDNLPKWDGVKRVEDLFVKYLDADNNNYTREITRKWFAAAVARIYEPGGTYKKFVCKP